MTIDIQKFVQCLNGRGHFFSAATAVNDSTVVRNCLTCGYEDVLLDLTEPGEGQVAPNLNEPGVVNGNTDVQP